MDGPSQMDPMDHAMMSHDVLKIPRKAKDNIYYS